MQVTRTLHQARPLLVIAVFTNYFNQGVFEGITVLGRSALIKGRKMHSHLSQLLLL
jgi:hypothetical protein